MSLRYVGCAPSTVGARLRRAERSSVLGICLWPFIVRQHAPIVHPWPCRSPQRPTARAVSSVGTFRTCPGGLTTSAPGGRTDLPRKQGHFRFLTQNGRAVQEGTLPSL